jgi:hypothetical protein
MGQPFEFIPENGRKSLFLILLALAILIVLVFQVLDIPLRTEAAPAGMVSFELAGSTARAARILASWGTLNELGSFSAYQPLIIMAVFGLGLDYLFMPVYAAAASLAILMVTRNQAGGFAKAAPWFGWAPLAAAMFDALENFSLMRLLLGDLRGPWAGIAAACAIVKFALVGAGILYALAGWVAPRLAPSAA